MYDIPSHPEVREVVLNEETIANQESPMLVYEDRRASGPAA